MKSGTFMHDHYSVQCSKLIISETVQLLHLYISLMHVFAC